MLKFPIVDSHLHVWDPVHLVYPRLWNYPLINRPFLLEDFHSACDALKIEKMVFIQAQVDYSQFLNETEWVTQLSRKDKKLQGIVSWAPLEKGYCAEGVLKKLAQNKLVKGIRRMILHEPDIHFCLEPDFVLGVQLLAEFQLSFDICISYHQISNVIDLVKQCPNVRFVLDHIGGPDIKNQIFRPWKQEIKMLAEFSNVCCKISGLVTAADKQHWTTEHLIPYIHHVIDCFGFNRIMFGGDFPVVLLSCSYVKWVETLFKVLQGCSEEEIRKVFHDNATNFYRLS
jgi:L-fuconolactonase